MDNLDAILGKAIYDSLWSKCRGWIQCKIINDVCHISIKYNDIEYGETYYAISEKILNGDFTSEKVVNQFITNWRRYFMKVMDKKLFYPN